MHKLLLHRLKMQISHEATTALVLEKMKRKNSTCFEIGSQHSGKCSYFPIFIDALKMANSTLCKSATALLVT